MDYSDPLYGLYSLGCFEQYLYTILYWIRHFQRIERCIERWGLLSVTVVQRECKRVLRPYLWRRFNLKWRTQPGRGEGGVVGDPLIYLAHPGPPPESSSSSDFEGPPSPPPPIPFLSLFSQAVGFGSAKRTPTRHGRMSISRALTEAPRRRLC